MFVFYRFVRNCKFKINYFFSWCYVFIIMICSVIEMLVLIVKLLLVIVLKLLDFEICCGNCVNCVNCKIFFDC